MVLQPLRYCRRRRNDLIRKWHIDNAEWRRDAGRPMKHGAASAMVRKGFRNFLQEQAEPLLKKEFVNAPLHKISRKLAVLFAHDSGQSWCAQSIFAVFD